MIAGVILAAGRSTRMGRPKSLLTCRDGRTFARALVDALRDGGVSPLVIVGRPDDRALRGEVEAIGSPVTFVANSDADAGGQLSSVLAGLREADGPDLSALMVVPVDAPLIAAETVSTLIAAFGATAAPVVRARYQGRNGHPVIFSRKVFGELRAADPALGAKAVLRAHANHIVNVDVDDPGVLGDIDTPDDYRRLIAGQT
jgi:molybdenum cofactor cytidylyltransferase